MVAPIEKNVSRLDVGKKRVLLRLVEPMDLVDEKKGAAAVDPPFVLRPAHDVLDLLDPGRDGAEGHEGGLGSMGDDPGESRLSRSRRAPENERADLVFLDCRSKRGSRTDDLFLSHDLVQVPRAHPLR